MKALIKLSAAIAAFLLILFAQSCSASDWPTQNSNNQNNPLAFDTFREGNNSYSINLGTITTGPTNVVANGIIYSTAEPASKTLSAYRLSDGQIIWQKSYNTSIYNIVYDSRNIYFASDEFYSLDAETGDQNWKSSICGTKICKVLRIDGNNIYGYRTTSIPSAQIILLDKISSNLIAQNTTASTTMNIDVEIDNSSLYLMSQYSGGAITNVYKLNKSDLTLEKQLDNCPVRAYGGLLDIEYSKLYLSADTVLCTYDLNTLTLNKNLSAGTFGAFVKYGNNIYGKGSYSVSSFGANETTPLPKFFQTIGMTPSSNALVVNGVLYYGTNTGKIWGYNLETGQQKTWDIEVGSAINSLKYSDGHFIITSRVSNLYKLFVVDLNNLSLRLTNFTLNISSPYNLSGTNQYLGQIHCHYIPDFAIWNKIWNREPSPEFTANAYKEKGYDFVALTEHNQVVSMPVTDGILQIQNSEESTQGLGKHHLLALGINDPINDESSDQDRINQINSQNGIAILAHPDSWVYGALSATIEKLSGLKYLETYSHGTKQYMPDAFAFDDFDYLLSKRNNKFLTAGDDYTPGDGFIDGGAIVVFAQNNSQLEIMNNIRNGNFYALQGSGAPRINNISADSISMSISVNEPSTITFIGKNGNKLKSEKNASSSIYSFQGDEIYVRAEIKSDKTGKYAWSQPIYISEDQQSITIGSGLHTTTLENMILNSNSNNAIFAKTVATQDTPSATPPTGYLSPIYQFTTEGQVNPGTILSISYKHENLPVNPKKLSIYSFDELSNSWNPIPSVVDEENMSVAANLEHFSYYTLGADIPDDIEPPSVSLVEPVDLSNISGETLLVANASDNEAVVSVKFYLDQKLIDTDLDSRNGWTANLDSTNTISGIHKLTITAEDLAGNLSSENYDVTIASHIAAPTISLNSPSENQRLFVDSDIQGNYLSSITVEQIGIYLDNVFVKNASVDKEKSTFLEKMNWSQFKEGTHTLGIVLSDTEGNTTSSSINIEIAQNVTATIISPANQNYLSNQKIDLVVNVQPTSENVVILIDGKQVPNNTKIDLIGYHLGRHTIEVQFGDKIIASSEFQIVTNYDDTRSIVARLSRERHIKNAGIAHAIISKLKTAQMMGKRKNPIPEKTALIKLALYIFRQSIGSNAKIDGYARNILLEHISYLVKD
ncbi:MAG: Ig-like domain-containing protein [Patescibacteria group bacterium]